MKEKTDKIDKKKIIEAINSYKNTPIAPQKSNVLENTSATHYKDLMQYNAMLDNITIGPHTNITINHAGVDWTFRLLTAEEYVTIRMEVEKECKEKEFFSDYFIAFNHMRKFLARALTPSPFKREGEFKGKPVFTEEDLRHVNFDILESLYIQYLDFVNMATKKPTELEDEEIQALWRIVVKKPEALRELERPKLHAIALYGINYSRLLEKTLESDTSNSSS